MPPKMSASIVSDHWTTLFQFLRKFYIELKTTYLCMVLSIIENITSSFEFAKDGLVGYWTRWIILLVVSCIPILNFISSGYLVKIYRGGDTAPELEGYAEMLIDGIKLAIIGFLYVLIPIMLMAVGVFFLEAGVETGELGTGIMVVLVGFVLALIFGLLALIGCIRFAKEGALGEGFNFGAILETIGEIGWGHYILSYILFIIVVGIVVGILSLIPFIGWLLLLIIMPFILLWQGKFLENLYSCA